MADSEASDGAQPSRFVPAIAADEVAPGEARGVTIEGLALLICNVDGQHYAIDDECTHDGQALDSGRLDGCIIECPRHGARFDVRTGAVKALPATRPLGSYPVRVTGGLVEVALDEPAEDNDDDLLDF